MKIKILTERLLEGGLGHVFRCLNLAQLFLDKGYEVSFFVRGDTFGLGKIINKHEKIYFLNISWEFIKDPSMLNNDICIIDSYQIKNFDNFIANSKIVMFLCDDFRKRHFLKYKNVYILNQNGIYKNLDLRERVFSGIEFAIINNCFKLNSFFNSDKKIFKYFISFGAEDKDDLSFEAFNHFSDCVIVLGIGYTGKLNKFRNKTENKLKKCKLIFNSSQENIARLISISTYSIVSGGGILLEALHLCEFIFCKNSAENQILQIESFKDHINIISNFKMVENINNIVQNKLIGKVGKKKEKIVLDLTFECINSDLKKKSQNFSLDNLEAINFCNMNVDETEMILNWRNHENVRKYMLDNDIIKLQNHLAFIKSLEKSRIAKYFLVKEINKRNKEYIGVIALSRINIKHKNAYLGIYKNPFSNSSFGSKLIKIIKHICFILELEMLYLETVATNLRGIRLYEKEGFNFLGTLKNGFFEKSEDKFKDILIYGIKITNEINTKE